MAGTSEAMMIIKCIELKAASLALGPVMGHAFNRVVYVIGLILMLVTGARCWRWLAAVSRVPLPYVVSEVFRRGGP
jgi:hypothetical protein